MNSLVHQSNFFNNLIFGSTHAILAERYIAFWVILPIFDSYDAMGVALMGGEL